MRHGTVPIPSLAGWSLTALVLLMALGCTTQPSDSVRANGGAGTANGGTANGGTANGGAPQGGAAPSAGLGNMAGSPVLSGSGTGGSGGSSEMTPDSGPSGGVDSGPGPSDAAPPDAGAESLPKRVLLYHYSTLDIPSVPAQLDFFKGKLSAWDYEAEDSVDPATLSDQNLARYAAVAMINTCFEPFGKGKPDTPQSQALQRFLQRGGGLFGTHCAAVTFQSATPPVLYNQLIGGRGGDGSFDGTSTCHTMGAHPTTSALPASFSFAGNLDNTDFVATDTVVLLKCQWQGGAAKNVNVSWYRSEGLGRVFYTNFAKVSADLSDATIGSHIVGGLEWVLHRR